MSKLMRGEMYHAEYQYSILLLVSLRISQEMSVFVYELRQGINLYPLTR